MWDTKYRPLRFTDVLGQEGHVEVLKARLRKGSGLDTSYIFWGGHGQGKTTLARIHARALLCQQLKEDQEPCNECDNCLGILNGNSEAYVEQDAASRGTVDTIRGIVDDLPFMVQGAPKRIYVFDEAHRMTKEAQDVLLKPIEDKKMVGMFCTTEPEKIRGPIRSRCEEYPIRKVTREQIAARMKWVLEQEKVEFEDDAIFTVVDQCGGHVRDVLNRLEMIGQMGPISLEAVRAFLNLGMVSVYYEILLALGEPAKALALVEHACDRVAPEEVATGLAEAAMNSYRFAYGMYADFSLADRKLGEAVHKMYGDTTVQLADYFLQTYKPSKVGLLCDVIRCAKGVPAPSVGRSASPPVVVAVSAPPTVTVPMAAPPPTKPSTPEPVAPAGELPKAVAAPAAAAPEPAKASPVTPSEKLRPDGKGSLGTSDQLALTDLDHKAIKDQHPRGAQRKPEGNGRHQKVEGGPPMDLLPHSQWRHEFEEAWRGAHPNIGNTNGG